MFAFRLLLYVSIVILGTCFASTPFDEVKLNIFDSKRRSFEAIVLESLQTTENIFANKYVEAATDIAVIGLGMIPEIGPLFSLITVFRNLLAEESDWKGTFTRAISRETKRQISLDGIRLMESTMKSVESQFQLLSNSNPSLKSRKMVALILQNSIDTMINYFDRRDSLFKKYPLMSAPPLIELSLLIAFFYPLSNALNPWETQQLKIACKIRNVLLDYRERAVEERLDELNISPSIDPISLYKRLAEIRTMPYNPNGYNSSKQMDCEVGCQSTGAICIKDNYSTNEYFNSWSYERCLNDYVGFVRHRVEDAFPFDLLNMLCNETLPTSTGKIRCYFLL